MKRQLSAFLCSIASLLDFGGALIHREYIQCSDADAIRSDWEAVGRDLWIAIAQFDGEVRDGYR